MVGVGAKNAGSGNTPLESFVHNQAEKILDVNIRVTGG